MSKDKNKAWQERFDARVQDGAVYFDSTVQIPENAQEQIKNVASLPFVERMAVMPDAHLGLGATVGTVIGTTDVLIPAAVGVDIGCGIHAYKTSLVYNKVEHENLLPSLIGMLQAAIPHGRTDNGGKGDKGKFAQLQIPFYKKYNNLWSEYEHLTHDLGVDKHLFFKEHFATLGTGNHFVEIGVDQNSIIWILVHSGSRGPGAKLAGHFVRKAKEFAKRFYIQLPDDDLAFFVEGTQDFDDYLRAVDWATKYAFYSRFEMYQAALACLESVFRRDSARDLAKAETPHNFIRREKHFGKDMFVTRKGASSAHKGELVCIPGSMGTHSYVCEGLGNNLSMASSSHGAGRAMSRREAMRNISLDQHREDIGAVYANNPDDTIDESPKAYKDIDLVMESQEHLVMPLYKITPIVNLKG